MLSETKEQVQSLVNKIQVFDFMLNALGGIHKDFGKEAEQRLRDISAQKLKLIDELAILNGVVYAKPELIVSPSTPTEVA